MTVIAVIVFVSLYFVEAGYGMLVSARWGKLINNKVAWFFMEVPVFVAMMVLWALSPHRLDLVPLVFFLIFELHYFQRVFVFPFLMKGKSKMPIGIMLMGVGFNCLNAIMQGYWIFYESYNVNYCVFGLHYTDVQWLYSPHFILGTMLFFMAFLSICVPTTSSDTSAKVPTTTTTICPKVACSTTSLPPTTAVN